ncbi:SRPBCC family protein [Marinicella rhabdoformis]|uniref:SRPBCC family protein n=1 Tax=Marinicella rhabdoformis TaxID=2580566 RepID=UPI0012AED40E
MVEVVKSAIVTHTADEMYQLVNDVTSYPEFLKWCVKGTIHHQDGDYYEATLDMSVKGINVSFMTANRKEDRAGVLHLDLQLKKGPFNQLHGHWAFKPLGDVGCRVSLLLNYEVKSSVINQLFAKGFERIAERMVSDFVSRAGDLYA